MLDLTHHVNAVLYSIRARHADVLVHTSWWRRRLGKERWAIAIRPRSADFALFVDPQGLPAKGVGDMKLCNDPDKWPDEVCVAVAKWRLTDG